MKVNELFEKIEERFLPEDLNGEFQLQGNCIIWTYNLDNDSEEINFPEDDEDELSFNFEASSPAELLQEACDDDMDEIKGFLDELDEYDYWTFSEPETIGNIISFKIF
jgi:hypothetical protein